MSTTDPMTRSNTDDLWVGENPHKRNLSSEITRLSLQDMQALHDWLGKAIATRVAEQALDDLTPQKGVEVVEKRKIGNVTYRLEKVKCGKSKCKCRKGKLHGPYWYAYSWTGKKLKRKYIGKTLVLPTEVLPTEVLATEVLATAETFPISEDGTLSTGADTVVDLKAGEKADEKADLRRAVSADLVDLSAVSQSFLEASNSGL